MAFRCCYRLHRRCPTSLSPILVFHSRLLAVQRWLALINHLHDSWHTERPGALYGRFFAHCPTRPVSLKPYSQLSSRNLGHSPFCRSVAFYFILTAFFPYPLPSSLLSLLSSLTLTTMTMIVTTTRKSTRFVGHARPYFMHRRADHRPCSLLPLCQQ